MGKNKIFSATIIGAAGTGVLLLISIILSPLISNTIGIEAYGFVSLAKTFISYANILTIALNSCASRYISVSYLKNDTKEFQKYFSTVFIADLILALVLFSSGIFFVFFLERILVVPYELIYDVKILFFITFLVFFVSTISTVFFVAPYIRNRLDLHNAIKLVSYILQFLFLIISFKFLTPHIWYVSLASFISVVFIFGGNFFYTKNYLPEAKLSWKNFDKFSLRILLANGIWYSINNIGFILNSGLDLLFSNLFLTSISMGQIAIAKTVGSIMSQVNSVIGQPFQPEMLKAYSDNDIEKIKEICRKAMQVGGIFSNLVYAGFFVLGQNFFNLWLPGQDFNVLYKLTLLALFPFVTEGIVYPLFYIYVLTEKNKLPCFISIFGGVLNVLGMFVFLKYTSLEAYGVLLTTAIIMTIINIVFTPIYLSKCLKAKVNFLYSQVLRSLISFVVLILLFVLMKNILPLYNKWLWLLLNMLILIVIGLIVQIPIQLSKEEIHRLFIKIRRL